MIELRNVCEHNCTTARSVPCLRGKKVAMRPQGWANRSMIGRIRNCFAGRKGGLVHMRGYSGPVQSNPPTQVVVVDRIHKGEPSAESEVPTPSQAERR